MIGADTGPLHLAAAVGVSCVGLYGPTRVENSGPYGPNHLALQAASRPVRNRRQRRLDDTAIRQITVEQVCEAVDVLMRRNIAHHPHAA
jgi:ADP-heptose:LPS heptosyltransferase